MEHFEIQISENGQLPGSTGGAFGPDGGETQYLWKVLSNKQVVGSGEAATPGDAKALALARLTEII